MNKPQISIIIPTHNRAAYLDYELEQIYKQKDVDFEVFVVNDIEEKDEADDIVKKYPNITYIKDSTIQGPSNKHKAGYKIARGEYFYMPDDDDFLIDDMFFAKAVAIMDADKDIAFCSGAVILSYEDEGMNVLREVKQDLRICGKIDGRQYLYQMQRELPKPASTISTLFRKSTFDALDAVNMIEMSDTSIYLMALMGGDAYIMEDIVAKYRIKANSLTTTASLTFLYNVLAQKESFLRTGKDRMINAAGYWLNHFAATYSLLYHSNNTKKDKFRMLLWGLRHSHGYYCIVSYIFKQILILLRPTDVAQPTK